MDNIRYLIGIKLLTDKSFFGSGVADLLKLVGETNSLHKACERMNMSYSKGWKIIKIAEKNLDFPLLLSRVGGSFGGGSELTEDGQKFLECFLNFKRELYESGDILFRKHFNNYL